MELAYLKNGETLVLNEKACTGCGDCIEVCPHAVFELADDKVRIRSRESCMECGACMRNCPYGAIRVKVGVGCAAAVIQGKLKGTQPECGCSSKKEKCC
jgi:NAD-dependent dihydropyrimidine dehydrogenase PreA subunit